VKITPEGKVKVLDFGLAKAMDVAPTEPARTNSPTLSVLATNAGVILGTAGYMSPEQAKGRTADQRSDIFSFGCILYEMITGRTTFDGETVTEVIASVLKQEADLSLIPANIHPRVVDLIRRCLVKDPKKRWHAAADRARRNRNDPYGVAWREICRFWDGAHASMAARGNHLEYSYRGRIGCSRIREQSAPKFANRDCAFFIFPAGGTSCEQRRPAHDRHFA
jgi:eukaryotic-like serine/threonine-protein kinase